MSAEQLQFLISLLTGMGSLLVAGGTLAWFIATQFRKNRSEFWRGLTELHNTITSKIDDHAKDDKIQFKDLSNEMWRLRLAVARGNGEEIPHRPESNGDF
jgi:hypothetical protein